VASCGRVFINVFRLAATMEVVIEVRRHVERHWRVWPDRVVSITVIEPSAGSPPPADVRAQTSALTREYKSTAAIVIEGNGFRAAAMRTVISGMYLFSRQTYPYKILGTVAEGARWIESAAGEGLRATVIERAVETAREAIH
jgi:hypothetical protein